MGFNFHVKHQGESCAGAEAPAYSTTSSSEFTVAVGVVAEEDEHRSHELFSLLLHTFDGSELDDHNVSEDLFPAESLASSAFHADFLFVFGGHVLEAVLHVTVEHVSDEPHFAVLDLEQHGRDRVATAVDHGSNGLDAVALKVVRDAEDFFDLLPDRLPVDYRIGGHIFLLGATDINRTESYYTMIKSIDQYLRNKSIYNLASGQLSYVNP